MLLTLLKIFRFKLRKLFACCFSQMGRLAVLMQKLLKLNSGNNLRYAIFGVLIGLFLVMYGFPSFIKWTKWLNSGHIASCIDGELYAFEDAIKSNDAVYVHTHKTDPNAFSQIPLSGNGFLLVSMTNGELYIRHRRTLSLPSHVGILYQADISNVDISTSEGVFITNVADGYVQSMKCFHGLDHPASIFSKVYVHRKYPWLVVQEITVKNPSTSSLKVTFRRQSASHKNDLSESSLISYVTPSNSPDDKSKLFLSRKVLVDIPDSQNSTILHILQHGLPPEDIIIQPKKTESFIIFTLANYTLVDETPSNLSPAQEKEQSERNRRFLNDQLSSLPPDSKALFRQHSDISRRLFRTGFGVSHSKAPDAINGDRVNLTLYYVSAHYQTIAQMKPVAQENAEKIIFDADKCYDDHFTLQFKRLWDMPKSMDQYFDYCRMWMITLEKHGCKDLVATGAEGVLTSMVLSFGSLHFTSHHLEFAIHPSELHRDLMHFRGVPYGRHVTLNISVQMGDDNKAQLYVSVDRPNQVDRLEYYACDAGCLDEPYLLGQTPVRIPVKLTDPVMPILYITSDRVHIVELSDALHFKHIQEAPAHEDDVIALHKHGHQFGGLPTIFWITIILLIVIFHLFLVKLIVTEYYKTESKYSPPPASYHRMARFAA